MFFFYLIYSMFLVVIKELCYNESITLILTPSHTHAALQMFIYSSPLHSFITFSRHRSFPTLINWIWQFAVSVWQRLSHVLSFIHFLFGGGGMWAIMHQIMHSCLRVVKVEEKVNVFYLWSPAQGHSVNSCQFQNRFLFGKSISRLSVYLHHHPPTFREPERCG